MTRTALALICITCMLAAFAACAFFCIAIQPQFDEVLEKIDAINRTIEGNDKDNA